MAAPQMPRIVNGLRQESCDQLLLLLAELRKDPNSQPFLEPVPW